MKYRISIELIQEKDVKRSEYVGKDDDRANESGYMQIIESKELSEVIYEQSTDRQINLKGIIDAFNDQPRSPSGTSGGGTGV